mgnify:CR=1 FL=1
MIIIQLSFQGVKVRKSEQTTKQIYHNRTRNGEIPRFCPIFACVSQQLFTKMAEKLQRAFFIHTFALSNQ